MKMLVRPNGQPQYVSSAVLALCIFALLVVWAKDVKLPSQDRFILALEEPGATGLFQVFYDIGRGYMEQDSVRVPASPCKGICQIYFPLPHNRIRGLRIDSEIKQKTYRIKFMSFNELEWKAGDIVKSFKPCNDISNFETADDAVSVTVSGGDPYFAFSGDFSGVYARFSKRDSGERFLLYLLCLVASAIAFFLIEYVSRSAVRRLKLVKGDVADPAAGDVQLYLVMGMWFIVYLWLVSAQSLYALAWANHDDRLFLNMANNLLKGNWLGPYSEMTLAKGVFYPLWICFAFVLNIPLLLSEHLLYGLACVVLLISLRPFRMSSVAQLLLFAVLLFNPVGYNNDTALRVLRDGIYPSLTLLVVACAIGLAVRLRQEPKAWSGWSIGLGISLSAFWLTREEGVWILPILAVVFCGGLFYARPQWKRGLAACLVPFAFLIASNLAVSTVNYFKYEWFTTVEFKAGDFLDAYSALIRVKHAHWTPQVVVPTETRMRIYACSPTFSELKPLLEGPVGEMWTKESNSNEMRGWFMWAFRDAAARAGHYKDGLEARRFYRKIADEVNAACDDGQLDCYSKRSTMTPPWRWVYFPEILETAWRGLKLVCRFDDINVIPYKTVGDERALDIFRDLTRDRLSEEGKYFASGWIFHDAKDVDLDLSCPAEPYALGALEAHQSSEDVYEYFLKNGHQFPFAKKARFSVTASRLDTILRVKDGDRILANIPLVDGTAVPMGQNGLFFALDKGFTNRDSLARQRSLDRFRLRILEFVHVLYSYAVPWLFIGGLLAFTAGWIIDFYRKKELLVYVIGFALLLGVACRILVVSAVTVVSFECLNPVYLASAYPLLLGFICIAWGRLFTSIKPTVRFARNC